MKTIAITHMDWAQLVAVHESCRRHFGESRYTTPYPWEKRL